MKHPVHIPEPCTQHWNAMKPADNGRFCSSCNKVVKDFTRMSADEIEKYFAAHKGEHICGRYRIAHVTGSSTKRPGRFRSILQSVFIFLGISVFIQACIGYRVSRNDTLRYQMQADSVSKQDSGAKKVPAK